jgi:hypothetical protein
VGGNGSLPSPACVATLGATRAVQHVTADKREGVLPEAPEVDATTIGLFERPAGQAIQQSGGEPYPAIPPGHFE